MQFRGDKALLCLFLAGCVTAMAQEMMISVKPESNYSTVGFPPMLPEFKEMAKKLMHKCHEMGYQPPNMPEPSYNSSVDEEEMMPQNPFSLFTSLLSSILPPSPPVVTSSRMAHLSNSSEDMEAKWNVTEEMQNMTSLPDMINIMKNSTDHPRCFMQAFISPLAWGAVMEGGLKYMEPEDFEKLLWAAKPFLENMPPGFIILPTHLDQPRLSRMMRMFNDVFGSLSEEQRDQIRDWVKARVLENDCQPNDTMPKPPLPGNMWASELSQSHPPKPFAKDPDDGGPKMVDGKEQIVREADKEREKNDDSKKKEEKSEKGREVEKEEVNSGVEEEEERVKQENKGRRTEDMQWKEDKKGGVGVYKQTEKRQNGGLRFVSCHPRQPWLNREVLRIMGRFLSRLPPEEVKVIPSEELWEFFRSPDFRPSFHKVGVIKASMGRIFLNRLRQECSARKQDFLQHTASLGSLLCFYDDEASSLNETLSKHLLSQLEECQNTDSTKLKKQLVRKLFSSAISVPGPQLLESLGSGVSELPPSKLTRFSTQALNDTLPRLSKVQWNAAQAATLAKALLKKAQNISGEDLLSLGTVARGVASSMLKKVKGKELLKGEQRERLETISQKMSALQRKALLQGMRSDVNVSELVLSVPAPLLSSLSLSTLKRAQLTSVDQLEGRNWTRAQSAFLLKDIIGQKLKPKHLRKLGWAIQGVTCKMIDSISQNDTMESMEALSQSSGLLDKAQISCAAHKLFNTLEQERNDYFSNITVVELERIPTMMLIHLPAQKIRDLPASVCVMFLIKMKMANLSCLPHSSPLRYALTQKALDCLGKNTSDLSADDVDFLGPLLCELHPSELRSLAPGVLNSTLLALASCTYIRQGHRAELFTLVKETFGEPSNWSEEEMLSLRPFLLLNDSALRTLPNKPWLRSSLSDLMYSLPDQPSALVPEEFHSLPDLSILRWKLFVLTTRNSRQSSAPAQRRRRREAVAVSEPTADLILLLGEDNVFWSPMQLSNMSCESFSESTSLLGEIQNFTAKQLTMLCQKTVQCLGTVEQLNESQVVELGCVCQGFSAEELQQLNISSLDTLEVLSTCKWSQAQRRAMWQGFTKRSGMTAAQLGELEMVGLGQFICGLQPEEAQQLSTNSFREAAEVVGCAPCERPLMEIFKRKAVAAFGEPQSWSEGQVSALGNIIAGLNAEELQSLNLSVFSFIVSQAIPLIPPSHLANLSVSQVQALGPDNAAMVTDAQKVGLDENKKRALAETMGVVYTRSEESSAGGSQSGSGTQGGSSPMPQSGGAISNIMVGATVLLKPLLFLLLGFIC